MTLAENIILQALVYAVIVMWIVKRLRRKRRVSAPDRARIARAWATAQSQTDPVRQVLEADKVLDMALGICGFSGTLGDKLKAAGPRFRDIDAVWRAHKLRNHVAHEAHATATQSEAASALRAMKKGIEDLVGGKLS